MQLTARSPSQHATAGLAMLEALAALLVLTVGALGVVWWQQQAMVRQQQQIYQFIAIGLVDDLTERMRINASQTTLYALNWGESRQAAQDCVASACNRSQLAQWDIAHWLTALRAQLPKGDAAVYPLSELPGWWGISVGWSANKMTAASASCPARLQCWYVSIRPQR